jgi:hypothetical protein
MTAPGQGSSIFGTAWHKLGKKEALNCETRTSASYFRVIICSTIRPFTRIRGAVVIDVKRAERESIVCDVLDRFQIVGKRNLYPTQLSGGQQQLVGVARAVIANPKVISRGRADWKPAFRSGKETGVVQALNEGGHDYHSGYPLGAERFYGHRIIKLRDGCG